MHSNHSRRSYHITPDKDGTWSVVYIYEQDIAMAFPSPQEAQDWFAAHLAILTQDFDNNIVH